MKKSFRWGIPILDEGHVPVYNFMLRNYARADVTRNEFLCILHLAAYHYESERGESRPALETIAEEMGYKHKNSVYGLTKSLRDKGLLIVHERKGETSIYDVTPFSRRVLALWQGVTLECDTLESDASITLGSDGASHPSVPEEEKKEKETKKKTTGANAPKPRKPDKLFDAIAAVCGYEAADIRKFGGAIGQCKKHLADKGATPDDVLAFGDWWWEDDFRGKHSLPKPRWISEEWVNFTNAPKAQSPLRREESPMQKAVKKSLKG